MAKNKKSSGLTDVVAFVIALFLVAAIVGVGSHHGGHGGSKTCLAMERLWERAGGSSSSAFMAAEIAMAESSGQQYATDYDKNGTVDRGYWQINSINAGSSFNAIVNAKAAVRISVDGTNWNPWVTYQTGAYQGQC